MDEVRILAAGDAALVAQFGDSIAPEINDRVQALARQLARESIPGVTELTPTFRSLLVSYDPAVIRFGALKERILALCGRTDSAKKGKKKILKVPCCYGVHFGPDLKDMERHTGLTKEEIISIHSETDYRIYMLGFLPGFVYLGGLDPRLAMPRLATPRVRIPRGAVGIGGNQTGVYPLESPGGWRLIGSTPLDFYDPDRRNPVLCQAGDFIRFVPVNSCEYYDIRQGLRHGTYQPEFTEID